MGGARLADVMPILAPKLMIISAWFNVKLYYIASQPSHNPLGRSTEQSEGGISLYTMYG
jgi:hypothetical protein